MSQKLGRTSPSISSSLSLDSESDRIASPRCQSRASSPLSNMKCSVSVVDIFAPLPDVSPRLESYRSSLFRAQSEVLGQGSALRVARARRRLGPAGYFAPVTGRK